MSKAVDRSVIESYINTEYNMYPEEKNIDISEDAGIVNVSFYCPLHKQYCDIGIPKYKIEKHEERLLDVELNALLEIAKIRYKED